MAAEKDGPKLVRLRNERTGVVVTTTEDTAGRLAGFVPEKSTKKAAASDSAEQADK